MDLSIVRFNRAVDKAMNDLLEDGWDWPVDGCETLKKFVDNIYINGYVGYWVFKGSKPVGVLEFSPYSEDDSLLDLGLFVHKDFRGGGIAASMLHSAVKALWKLNIPCIATVSVDNGRSLALMRRATGLHGVEVFEECKGRHAWSFNFDVERFNPVLSVEEVVEVLFYDSFVLTTMMS